MAKHRAATGNPHKLRSVRPVPAHHLTRTPPPAVVPTWLPAPVAARKVETGQGAWLSGLTAEDAKYWRKAGA